MIKDQRFIPVERQEPIEEDDDFDEEIILAQYQKKSLDRERSRLHMAS
jgi:hypothetical protein